MASISTSRMIRPSIPAKSESILSFLVPAVQCRRIAPGGAHFSTSPIRCKKDNNSNRGLSAVRRTGPRPRQTLSMKQKDFANQQLPKPVLIEQKPTGTPDHGLWGFFKEKKLLQTPVEESQHGRAWTLGELRGRDWDTLHQLWWVCVKERNRLATEKLERHRLQAGYGDLESKNRDEAVQKTMKAIMDTLAERHLAFLDAHELAYQDPNIEMDPENGAVLKEQAYDPYEPEPEFATEQSTPAKQ